MSPDDTRFEVRRHLAERPTASLDIDSIHHGMRRKGLEVDKPSIEAALAFFMRLPVPQVVMPPSSINAKRYMITSAGVVAFENND
jgi:hypothetical protein